jgi:hypothetical protein
MAASLKQMSPDVQKFFGVLFAVAGCIFLAVGILSCLGTVMFLQNAVSVPGKVTALESVRSRNSSGRSSTSYHPVFAFNDTQGQSYTIKSETGSYLSFVSFYSVGEKVNVLYASNNPKNSRIDTWLDLWLRAAVTSFVGAIFLLVGIAVFKAGQRRSLNQKNTSSTSPISKPK